MSLSNQSQFLPTALGSASPGATKRGLFRRNTLFRLLEFGVLVLFLHQILAPKGALFDQGSRTTLTELIRESGSDKYSRHRYERYYEKWLPTYRDQPKLKILEIGAEKGSSLKVWSQYFSDPQLIMGLAYAPDGAKYHKTEGVKERAEAYSSVVQVQFGDQSKKETMDHLKSIGPWDIIIDDGSHVPQHMIFSMFSLWQSVKPGGLYVIEDIETNYWPSKSGIYSYGLGEVGIGAGPEHSLIPKLQQLQEVLVRHQIGAKELSVMPGDEDICSIEWAMNIVAIRKCSQEEKEAAPTFQKRNYDQDRMKKWIEDAKSTNPKV